MRSKKLDCIKLNIKKPSLLHGFLISSLARLHSAIVLEKRDMESFT